MVSNIVVILRVWDSGRVVRGEKKRKEKKRKEKGKGTGGEGRRIGDQKRDIETGPGVDC